MKDDEVTGTRECYDLSGRRVAANGYGLFIVRQNGKAVKVIK
ncbi:hypothetical protein [Prevotella sp. AGR2160]|nr:hypothetical protein [Prevotella sp. AGR2160]